MKNLGLTLSVCVLVFAASCGSDSTTDGESIDGGSDGAGDVSLDFLTDTVAQRDLAEDEEPGAQGDLAADAQTQEDLAADAQTQEDLAADAQTEEDLAADAQTQEDLAADSQTQEDLATDALTQEDLAADALTEEDLAADDLTEEDLAADDLTEEDLAADDLAEEDLAADAGPDLVEDATDDATGDDAGADALVDTYTDDAAADTYTGDTYADADTGVATDTNASEDADATEPVLNNVIFVTSEQFSPNFEVDGDPFAGADEACSAAALAADLDGNFIALIRVDGGGRPTDRLGAVRGWVRVDGAAVADAVTDFRTANFFHLFVYDEFGRRIESDPNYWTGGWGNDSGRDCNGWKDATDAFGGYSPSGYRLEGTWGVDWRACDEQARLLCAQNDYDLEVAPAPVVGDTRLFFTSAATQPNLGLDAFDALCQSEFEAEFGVDTGRQFRAFIPSIGLTAAERISQADATWIRADGAVFAETTAGFLDGAWDTWPSLAVNGNIFHPDNILFGAIDPRTAGLDTRTCRGWSSGLSTDRVYVGTSRFWLGRFETRQRDCDRPGNLYCAEDVL